jgi:hypothetical protein
VRYKYEIRGPIESEGTSEQTDGVKWKGGRAAGVGGSPPAIGTGEKRKKNKTKTMIWERGVRRLGYTRTLRLFQFQWTIKAKPLSSSPI